MIHFAKKWIFSFLSVQIFRYSCGALLVAVITFPIFQYQPFKSLTPYIPQTTLNKNKKNYIQFIDSNENKINSLLLHFYNATDKKNLQSQKIVKQANI